MTEPTWPADLLAELDDALLLVDFGLQEAQVPDDHRQTFLSAVAAVRQVQQDLSRDEGAITAELRTTLDTALASLTRVLSPVTATTIRASRPHPPKESDSSPLGVALATIRANRSWGTARLQMWRLWQLTALFGVLVMMSELFFRIFGAPLDATQVQRAALGDAGMSLTNWMGLTFGVLVPFCYGGLGACVALLRALHGFLNTSTFDPVRVPEYFNRVVLGVVAGGTVMVLTDTVIGDDGIPVNLSAAAMGFVAGYNTDFLFQALERVSSAVLPKVGISSVARTLQRSGAPTGPSALEGLAPEELLKRRDAAIAQNKQDDVALYTELLRSLARPGV
ncbi:MAG: hypothetical protein EAZ99_08915 [Alphaproteobacteria bacterium]|nr:MAG: hypothetical protein EAZ99_08915 [Alphaproteobacteria bacterium]